MQIEPQPVAFYPSWVALEFRDDFVFFEELRRRLAEGLLGLLLWRGFKETRAGFAAQFEISVLRDLFGLREQIALRAGAVLLTVHRSRALPERAVVALIDLDFATKNFVRRHMTLLR
jgi:hypothetical protein